MPKFGVKDIVKVKKTSVYYLVTDSEEDNDGVWYKLIKVFPVRNEFIGEIMSEEDLSIVSKNGQHEHKMITDYLDIEYQRIGFQDFEDFVDEALEAISWDRIKKRKLPKREKTVVKNNDIFMTGEGVIISKGEVALPSIPEQVENEVNYDEINDVNECLDLMNYFKFLYEKTGDEDWLKIREKVVKRLKQLIKEG